MAVLDDFHQIKALRLFGALYAEVVDDEKVGFGQASHQLAMRAIEPREFELLKKLLRIVIQRFEAEMTSMMTDSRQPLTVEFKINLIAPAAGDKLRARGNVLKAGRSIFHVAGNVFVADKGEETLIASALVTIKSTTAVAEIN